jgi:outer membrane receptor protein involved in Fe transport
MWLGGVSLVVLAAQGVVAQTPTPQSPGGAAGEPTAPSSRSSEGPAASSIADIVVTGSRIRSNGNNLPNPTTVVSVQQLQTTTPTSIPDALVKLPAFNVGQNTPNSAINSNGRGFGAPGNFLDLRTLGPIRTLILQDGNRVPGTFYDQTVDTNMLPQLLIQRVDIVTGGASSVYGSDGITGVVNFITDSKFTGLKGVVQGGISKYGDGKSVRAGAAYGVKVGDRGHFEVSAEYYKRNGIHDTASRAYGELYPIYVGSGTAANPFVLVLNGKQSNVAPGGLAVTGPFAGQQFLNDGSLATFNPGVATPTANAAIGGDGGRVEHEDLLFRHRTAQAFARFDYDVTDAVHFYVQGRLSQNRDSGKNQIYTNVSNASAASPTNTGGSYPLWIYSGNAYLTAAQQALLTSSGTSSFALNRMDNDLMRQLGLNLNLRASAVTAGLDGKLGLGDLAWDAHYTRGDNRTRYTTTNNVNAANFFAATDAVRDPATGSIVCRVTITAPGTFPGCAPIDLFGQNRASQAAQDFIFENTYWTAKNSMDDFGANLNGTLFEGWAGPFKFAAGGQYRHQTLDVTTSVPVNVFNPQYLRLGPAGNSAATSYPSGNLAYFKETQSAATGDADIYEANVELNAPLLRDLPFVQLLSFNGAFRYAKYEVEGNQTFSNSFSSKTWKLGLEWSVNDDLRIRATRSRDFRAPTLWELYQQQVISASGVTDTLTNTAGSVNTVAGGNPNLKPEIGKNLTVGAVLTPHFIPRFSVSVDYFDIKLKGQIGGINGLDPTVQAICQGSGGSSQYCTLVQRPISYNNTSPANFPTLIFSTAQNTVSTRAQGLDFELNYAVPLGAAGELALRGLWSHQWKLVSTSFPGAPQINQSGTMALPRDKVTVSANYRLGRFGFDWLQRYYSSIKFDANPAIIYADPKVKAYLQSDINFSYDINVGGTQTLFLNINNIFNAKGQIYQNRGYTGSPGLRYPNFNYADLLGTYFTAGVRFKL